MKSKPVRLSIPGAFAAAAALLFAAGCPNSDSVTGPGTPTPVPSGPTPTLTPTPTPVPSGPTPTLTPTPTPTPGTFISGAWQGTFKSEWATAGCGLESPARATFTQVGIQVTGHLEVTGNPCGFRDLTFEGTMELTAYPLEFALSGQITGDPFTEGTAHGRLSSESTPYDYVLLGLRNGPRAGGIMYLTR